MTNVACFEMDYISIFKKIMPDGYMALLEEQSVDSFMIPLLADIPRTYFIPSNNKTVDNFIIDWLSKQDRYYLQGDMMVLFFLHFYHHIL